MLQSRYQSEGPDREIRPEAAFHCVLEENVTETETDFCKCNNNMKLPQQQHVSPLYMRHWRQTLLCEVFGIWNKYQCATWTKKVPVCARCLQNCIQYSAALPSIKVKRNYMCILSARAWLCYLSKHANSASVFTFLMRLKLSLYRMLWNAAPALMQREAHGAQQVV